MFNFLFNIALSLATGVLSGLVVARWSTLKELTRQAHTAINNWEYMKSNSSQGWEILKEVDVQLLENIASNLFYLKQVEKGKAVQEAVRAIKNAQSPVITPVSNLDLHQIDTSAHKKIRKAKINWLALLASGPL